MRGVSLVRRGAAALALALGVLAAPAAVTAGVMFVDEGGDRTLLSTGRVKIAPASPDAPTFVLDMARGRMWVANRARRTFWEGTIDEYCAGVTGSIAGGAARPVRVTVERTAHTETIAGWPTRKYRVLADGVLHEELWLTSETSVARALDAGRAADTVGRMMGCMLAVPPGPGVESSAEYRKLYAQGWPLRSVYYGAGGASGQSSIVTAGSRDIAEQEFAPPSGYRRAPFAEVVGGGAR
ncbi:MAG TPA: hypothetical protein VMR23_04065 [Candidatus Limnocylindria bacterium]|nr:hypothetical protein [Candidatus Limnocylindria bacterium]